MEEFKYHEGELAVQRRANGTTIARRNSVMIRKEIPRGAMGFIESQPMTVVGSMDHDGQVWASIVLGQPGFMRAVDNQNLKIDLSTGLTASGDPLLHNLDKNPSLGLLLIDFRSRRRLRINGRVQKLDGDQLNVHVQAAYANCPKYIQKRNWSLSSDKDPRIAVNDLGKHLRTSHMTQISKADTMFVGSGHPVHGVDVSHRGGHPGFVTVENNTQLLIPDYVGNMFFNTLGNLESYPWAGVTFIDFDRCRLLQLTGRATVLWDHNDPENETGGTRRFWRFDLFSWRESSLPHTLEWQGDSER